MMTVLIVSANIACKNVDERQGRRSNTFSKLIWPKDVVARQPGRAVA
jgi:hypothetical protein